ncbi:MAG TPA: flavin reductase family protein [Ktedonobacterales bacterium]|nr:flavin reductase family protein [Ktedonobacterales bacterium]
MSVREADFRAVMGRFATGVTVVTTMRDDCPLGITVNAFTSLSLDPPLVLICIERRSYLHDSIRQAGFFAANLLDEDQRELAIGFATHSDRRDRDLYGVRYHAGVTGAPIFDQSLGYVECRLVNVYPGGDHGIFVGEVVALDGTDQNPLLYYRGKYGAYAPYDTSEQVGLAAPAVAQPSKSSKNGSNGSNGTGRANPLADGRVN